MLTTATKRKIDTARDILVGKIPVPTSQVEQITLALVYKFMSDMDKRAKDLGDSSGFFANGYGKYAWDKLMDKALPARDRVLLYREALEKMSLNPHIPQLFRDVFRDASLPFNDPETLKLFLDVIDQFEYDHSEELGNAFEYLLQVMGSQGDAGQFRTPRHIIDFIVDVVEPSKTDKILDPACGTAGFLISAYNHIKNRGLSADEMTQLSENFVGYDISQDMQRLSLVNLYLHHFPNPHIYEYDTLTSEDRWSDDFDVILANPPFMTPKGGIRPHNRFSVPSKRAEVLFVDYIMEHLTARGKAGVIVPEGIIFQSQNAYKQLRKMMVEENYLWAVVSLPSGVFNPYSGVKTSILLFDREIAKKTNNVLFVRIDNDGFDLGAQRKPVAGSQIEEATRILCKYKQDPTIAQDKLEEYAEDVASSIELRGKDLKNYETVAFEPITPQLVKKSEIAKSGDYNLSGERYVENHLGKSSMFSLVKLEDIAEVISGQSPSGEFYNNNKQGLPFFQGKSEFGQIYLGNPTTWTTQVTKEAETNDILMSVRAPVGTVNICNQKICIGRGLAAIRPNSKVLGKFLFYFLRSQEKSISKLGTGSTFKSINRAQIQSIEIPLPPISVQQEIVDELDRYQKIIDGAKQVVENYKPDFEIETNWEVVELGQVSKILSGGTPSKSNKAYWQGNIPWVSPKDMKSLEISDTKDHISKIAIDESATRLVDPKTVLCVVRSGILKHSLPVGITTKAVAFNQDISAIQTDRTKLNPKYLFYFLIQNEQKILSEGIKPGVTVQSFYSGFLSKFKVPLPILEKQNKIVEILDNEAKQIKSVIDLITSTEDRIKNKIESIWNG